MKKFALMLGLAAFVTMGALDYAAAAGPRNRGANPGWNCPGGGKGYGPCGQGYGMGRGMHRGNRGVNCPYWSNANSNSGR